MLVIYMEKNLIKYGHPNHVETLKDCIRMALIFTDFYQLIALSSM